MNLCDQARQCVGDVECPGYAGSNACQAENEAHAPEQATAVQATATGLAMLALQEKGFTVEEINPSQLRITSPDGQGFTLTVTKRAGR